jgi:hypothetical protein
MACRNDDGCEHCRKKGLSRATARWRRARRARRLRWNCTGRRGASRHIVGGTGAARRRSGVKSARQASSRPT